MSGEPALVGSDVGEGIVVAKKNKKKKKGTRRGRKIDQLMKITLRK